MINFYVIHYLIESIILVGMNSILVYMGHIVLQPYFPFSVYVTETYWSKLAINFWGPAVWCFASYLLYRKDVLLKI